jgi:hypothetical protein
MRKNRPLSTWADWVQVIVQSLLLLGAIYAVCIYKGQLVAMRESNELLKASTDAATKAAKAAEDSVTLARDMSRLDQRAWVAPSGISGLLKADQPFVCSIRIKNTGKTFARYTQVNAQVGSAKKGMDPPFDKLGDPPANGKMPVTITLAPNGEYELLTDPTRSFNQQEIENIRDNGDFFVFGRIDYTDVFDRSHWTTFCFRYDLLTDGYDHYGKHNDADNRNGD